MHRARPGDDEFLRAKLAGSKRWRNLVRGLHPLQCSLLLTGLGAESLRRAEQ